MENQNFECKIHYEKTLENGMVKKVSESYLVEALNFSEAETRISEEMGAYIKGDFEVASVMRRHFAEIFTNDNANADRWYKAKLIFTVLDEKTAQEKKTAVLVLVQAADFDDAYETLVEKMKGTMSDYEINTLQETSILDYYKLETQEK